MVAWYMHDIPAWMDGTESLDDGAYRVYHVVCQLIYFNDGPITLHEHGIAGRCNMHILSFRKHLKTLLDLGKLTQTDGRLSNNRAATELERVHNRRLTSAKGGRASAGVRKTLNGSQHHNALKNSDQPSSTLFEQQHHKKRVEESREDKNQDATPNGVPAGELDLGQAAPAKPPNPQRSDPETELFQRGREILGKSAGGLINQLLKAKGKPELARAAMEVAATKENPREYIGAILRGSKETEDDGIWRKAHGAIV
jgi:hypothetical protein